MESLNVLVVDDSALYRKLIQGILQDIPKVSVLGTAQNGHIALKKVEQLKPDVLILDLEMSGMSGLEIVTQLRNTNPSPGVIILSSSAVEAAASTLQALDRGAFEFIPKPDTSPRLPENRNALQKALAAAIAAYQRLVHVRRLLRPAPQQGAKQEDTTPAGEWTVRQPGRSSASRPRIAAVGIGISTGGPAALARVFARFNAGLDVPIFIVQHMPPVFTRALAEKLNSLSRVPVKEAEDREPVRPGVAYLAPGGKQMRVSPGIAHQEKIIRISDDPPLQNCKPSVDYLFHALAEQYAGQCLGVIMTGMGADGTEGLKKIKALGGLVLAQDEATSTVYSMPKKPVDAGLVDIIAPLDGIALEIQNRLGYLHYSP